MGIGALVVVGVVAAVAAIAMKKKSGAKVHAGPAAPTAGFTWAPSNGTLAAGHWYRVSTIAAQNDADADALAAEFNKLGDGAVSVWLDGAPLPADWPADDRDAGRTRSQIVPSAAGQIAPVLGAKVWELVPVPGPPTTFPNVPPPAPSAS